jgi:hypothetical protein
MNTDKPMSYRSSVFWVSDVAAAAEALAMAAWEYAPKERKAFVEAAAREALKLDNAPLSGQADKDCSAEGVVETIQTQKQERL